MTKRDFRARRDLFKGQIQKRRDFDHFKALYDRRNRQQGSRLMLAVLISLVVGLIVFLLLL